MTSHSTELPGWTRRDFVSAGLGGGGKRFFPEGVALDLSLAADGAAVGRDAWTRQWHTLILA